MLTLRVILAGFDPARRSRLREMLREALFKSEVEQLRKVSDILETLEGGMEVDVAIVPASPRREAVLEFIARLQEIPPVSRPLVIVCLRGSDHDSILISEFYLAGVDGFLSEPFSELTLEEVLKTAEERKATAAQNSIEKDRQVAVFLLGNVMRLLDEIARQRKSGKTARGRAGKRLSEVSRVYKETMQRVGMEGVLDKVIEKFETAEPFESAVVETAARAKLKIALHPSVHIQAILKKRAISREKLFELMHVDQAEFDAVLDGQADLTEAMADELARVIGGVPEYWLQLQGIYARYREALAKEEEAEK